MADLRGEGRGRGRGELGEEGEEGVGGSESLRFFDRDVLSSLLSDELSISQYFGIV